MATVMALGAYAETLVGLRGHPVTFVEPKLRIEHLGDGSEDCEGVCIYQAVLTVRPADNSDTAVIIGRVDLLLLDLDEELGAKATLAGLRLSDPDVMDLWSEPEHYLSLFNEDGLLMGPAAEGLGAALIVRDAFVDPCFRGHRLGAWMIAQLNGHFVETPTAVIGWPRSWDDGTIEATERCRTYWQTHLNLIYGGDGFDSQLLDSPAMVGAADALAVVESRTITVDSARLAQRAAEADPELWLDSYLPDVERVPPMSAETIEHLAAVAGVMTAAEEFEAFADLVPVVYFEATEQYAVFAEATEFLAANQNLQVVSTSFSRGDGVFRLTLTFGLD